MIKHTLQSLKDKDATGFKELYSKENKNKEDISKIREMIKNTGSLDKTICDLHFEIDRSTDLIKNINISDSMKTVFMELVNSLRLIDIV